jgi:hypothetical protein
MKIMGVLVSIVLFFIEANIVKAILDTFATFVKGDPIGSIVIVIIEVIGLLAIPFLIFGIVKTAFTSD